MRSGVLKFFDPRKDWGFIVDEETGKDVFVHGTAVHRSGIEKLIEGDPIWFQIFTNPKTGKNRADRLSLTQPAN